MAAAAHYSIENNVQVARVDVQRAMLNFNTEASLYKCKQHLMTGFSNLLFIIPLIENTKGHTSTLMVADQTLV
ncbi:hypothetical protein APHCRT_0775 [Anaplasma phagocytophilum str. CRT53-1]|uniref:Uncharacterized protein n=2 Tax=Anaplasma phagocytophilum TaxID=948 RepID=A0A0F3Q0U7_ANAPH|nr:hypothetical protein CRT38_02862 [Anaplasma phagocytophilum str. CRT38]KDB57253.1 hypothetical protein P030_04325 [Anaplasma phagocytophilum str. CRT35]KJV86260.1 hypothetical protein APHCRT_0775 [Anaplasma phagocytophilum str. CRT53-1]